MKDLKISAELLSEVLKLEVVKHSLYNELHKSFNITYMQSEDSLKSSWMPINIYEFAFKCKEWAFKRELNLWTDYLGNCQIQDKEFQLLHDCYSDTEIEAIIKACDWILENKDNK